MNVNPATRVPLSSLGLVTTTFTAPPACDGVVATIVVLVATTTIVAAGIPPKLTVAPGTKFVPVIVTVVPPFEDPEFGSTLVTVGVGPANWRASAAASRLRTSLLVRGSLPSDSKFRGRSFIDVRFSLTVSAGADGGGGSNVGRMS
jgi:hypothetical protein